MLPFHQYFSFFSPIFAIYFIQLMPFLYFGIQVLQINKQQNLSPSQSRNVLIHRLKRTNMEKKGKYSLLEKNHNNFYKREKEQAKITRLENKLLQIISEKIIFFFSFFCIVMILKTILCMFSGEEIRYLYMELVS